MRSGNLYTVITVCLIQRELCVAGMSIAIPSVPGGIR